MKTNRQVNDSKKSTSEALFSIEEVLVELRRIDDLVNVAHQPIINDLQNTLSRIKVSSFGSFQNNQAFSDELSHLMVRLQLGMACPRCGQSSRFRVMPAQTCSHGQFEFRHELNGKPRGHAAPAAIPPLKLKKEPVNRRRRPRPCLIAKQGNE